MIRKLQNGDRHLSTSPIGSPYENVYYNRNNLLKPKSPNTQSPRSRIKTTYAHKSQPSPQYFIFPTPPVSESNKAPNFDINQKSQNLSKQNQNSNLPDQNLSSQNQNMSTQHQSNRDKDQSPKEPKRPEKVGIEKQLSLEEEIPMIDDVDVSNDIELRHSKPDDQKQNRSEQRHTHPIIQEEKGQIMPSNAALNEKRQYDISQEGKRQNDDHYTDNKRNSLKDDITETAVFIEREVQIPEKLQKNKSFEDVKKELMADIPELEEFEKDLKENKREHIIKHITENIRKLDFKADSIDSMLDDNLGELKTKYEKLKDDRKKLVTEIHEIKNKMTEIRSQEDDILREVSSFLIYVYLNNRLLINGVQYFFYTTM